MICLNNGRVTKENTVTIGAVAISNVAVWVICGDR
jgi:hypothetical protein